MKAGKTWGHRNPGNAKPLFMISKRITSYVLGGFPLTLSHDIWSAITESTTENKTEQLFIVLSPTVLLKLPSSFWFLPDPRWDKNCSTSQGDSFLNWLTNSLPKKCIHYVQQPHSWAPYNVTSNNPFENMNTSRCQNKLPSTFLLSFDLTFSWSYIFPCITNFLFSFLVFFFFSLGFLGFFWGVG